MSLIKCPECEKMFSDKASACPNCACPVEKEKIKVRIYNNGGFSSKCSVSIDNLPVGQLGGIMLGKQGDIEISLPIGIHYIGVSTQIEHGGQITGVVGVGQEQDGKQFEITNDDKYIEIEILAKGSFTGTSGRYIVGNIRKYNENVNTKIENDTYTTYNNQVNNTEKNNTFCLVGFIVALISLLLNLWGIVGISAVILSVIGLNQLNQTHETGKGMAIAGICIGFFSIIYAIFQFLFWYV